MLPRLLSLVIISISSAFLVKAQDQNKSIPPPTDSYTFSKGFKEKPFSGSPANFSSTPDDTIPATCFCNVSPQIVPAGSQGNIRTYQGIPNASCTHGSITFQPPSGKSGSPGLRFAAPPYGDASLPPADSCGINSITYSWSVVGGNSIAAISGSTSGSTVNVAISGNGIFTLNLINTVTCSDNSSCSYYGYYTDTVTVDTSHCTCTAGPVTIQPGQKQGNVWTYHGSVQGSCSSQYGIPPALINCNVQNTLYQWSIDGGGVASIVGPTNGQTVNVSITGNGQFNLRLDGTTVCNDGQRCTNYNFYQDSAKLNLPKSCSCSVDVDCERGADQGNLRTYSGILKGGCTGEYGPSPPYQPCAIKNVDWLWTITEGGDVVEIVGPANQQTVQVAIKGTGKYTLRVQADVECSDGTKSCGEFNFDYCMDSARIDKKCSFLSMESSLPEMKGGLSESVKKKDKIRRDEFVALIAEGKDFDKVTMECTPSYECDNSQKKSTLEVLLAGKLRFEWNIESGEGNFVKLGLLPENVQSDMGERVIFQPPYVPWPEKGESPNTKTTVIRLRIVDESGAGVLKDQDVSDLITITTTRRRNQDPDHYTIEIQHTPWTPPAINLQNDNNGVCKAASAWEKNNDLKKPVIKLPPVQDNDKMVLGQWMILEAEDQNETDELRMVCEAADCEDDGGRKTYPDNIEWVWQIKNDDGKKGKFIGGNTGRFVLYAAPDSFPAPSVQELTVDIEVRVQNTGVQINDVPVTSDLLSFKIFRPGVQLEYPPLDWLPRASGPDALVKLKSYLLYQENGTWKEALAHMGRIHFFELLDVSTERGVNMNYPTPDVADNCRDYLFEEEEHTEVFERSGDPALVQCNLKDTYFLHARSQKPKKEETVTVFCDDMGAYGFLRSFANINQGGRDSIKGELPVYVPVPVPAEKVAHPSGRPKKNIYTDNRVTVPRDVDENRIADGGWRVRGNVLIKDPANPQDDDDSQLPGDGYPGDGLSNYQEYRGFSVDGNFIRTHIRQKDLFIYNQSGFNLQTFKAALSQGTGKDVAGVDVHEIRSSEFINVTTREINFNYNPQLHYVPPPGEPLRLQKGLWIAAFEKKDEASGSLGQTYTSEQQFTDINTPPNWVRGILVFTNNIRRYAPRVGVNAEEQITHVATHELGHGIAMWHHGDKLHVKHGLQSGNINCIMRYDNILPFNIREAFGTIFCNHPQGTGSNLDVPPIPCVLPLCYGNALPGRGNCIHQFRISCRTIDFPKKR